MLFCLDHHIDHRIVRFVADSAVAFGSHADDTALLDAEAILIHLEESESLQDDVRLFIFIVNVKIGLLGFGWQGVEGYLCSRRLRRIFQEDLSFQQPLVDRVYQGIILDI